MFSYILKRIGFAILTLLVIIVFVYILVAIFAKNPFFDSPDAKLDTELERLNALKESIRFHYLTPDSTVQRQIPENILVRLGFFIQSIFDPNKPFGDIISPALTSSFGTIPNLFFRPLRTTSIIVIPAFVVSAILGILLGIFAGYNRGKIVDSGINFFVIFFVALPSFIFAPIVIAISIALGFPNRVLEPGTQQAQFFGLGEIIKSWVPPILVVTISSLAGYTSYTRNQVITVLTSNYVLIAKSKGLGRIEIFFKYVLRNISIPLVTLLIPSYIGLLSGSIIIERFWQIRGTSEVIVNAFPKGEINIIMFNLIFFTALAVFTVILVDVSYVILDPRIKYAQASQYNFGRLVKLYFVRRNLLSNRVSAVAV